MDNYIDKKGKEKLSNITGLSERSIGLWFTDQRRKQKREAGTTTQGTM